MAIEGTSGADTLNGASGNNTIYGYGGPDWIHGEQGNDQLYGGHGNDEIRGGKGNDTVYGATGHDLLYGGMDNDTVYGGQHNDTLQSGALGDTFDGYNYGGIDQWYGESGSDWFDISHGFASFGNSDYAHIRDFNSAEDTIYKGGYSNIQLIPSGSAVNIYTGGELLAIVDNTNITTIKPELDLQNPNANNDSFSVNEGSSGNFNVVNNDSDPDTNNSYLSISGISENIPGSVTYSGQNVTFNTNGQYNYLSAGQSTNKNFSYTIYDGAGGYDTATVTVTINGVNDVPTDLALTNNTILENEPANSVIGNFSTIDPDLADSHSYRLVSGSGSDDNSQFTISGNQLLVNNSLDFETKSSYSIRVQTDDELGATHEKVFTINVTDVNETPIAVDDPSVNPNPNLEQIGELDTYRAFETKVVGNIAYVSDGSQGLKIIDVSNPSDPQLIGSLDTFDARGIDIAEGLAYIADKQAGLKIIDVSDPTSPTLLGSLGTSNAVRVKIVGELVYLADNEGGLKVIDVSNPNFPDLIKSFDTYWAKDLKIVGELAYIADWDAGLKIIDISDPEEPILLGSLDTYKARGVEIVEDLAYIADWDAGLKIIDVSDPTSPILLGSLETNRAIDLKVLGSLAYVADANSGLKVIDVSDPYSPSLLGSLDTFAEAKSLDIVDGLASVGNDSDGLKIIDVSQFMGNITDEDTPINIDVLANDYDPDNDTISVNIVDDSSTTGNVTINPDGTVDYDPNGQFDSLPVGETATDTFEYSITDGEFTDSATVAITIEGVNDTPTDIILDNNSIAENEAANSVIGNFSTIDPDAGATHSYSLVSGIGSDDNSQFTVSGNQLLVNNSLDFETKSNYSIRVQTDDGNGGTYEQVFSINITDVNDPPVAVDDAATTDEDTPVTINVLANDFDPDLTPFVVYSADATISVDPLVADGLPNFGSNLIANVDSTPEDDLTESAAIKVLSDGDLLSVWQDSAGNKQYSRFVLNADGTYTQNQMGVFPSSTAIGGWKPFGHPHEPLWRTIRDSVADVNNDGFDDLLIFYNQGPSQKYNIALGQADGSFDFNTTPIVDLLENNVSIVFADSDNDGITDIVFGNIGTSDIGYQAQFYMLKGNGDGTFADVANKQFLFASLDSTSGIAFGDFNEDGYNDVFIAPEDDMLDMGQGYISFGSAGGYGTPQQSIDFYPAYEGAIQGSDGTAVDIIDIDLDGHLDLVAYNRYRFGESGSVQENNIKVYYGDGTGQFSSSEILVDHGTTSAFWPLLAFSPDASNLNGNNLSVASVDTSNTKGNATINPDGTVNYSPNGQFEHLQAGENATDTFTYTIVDENFITISVPGTSNPWLAGMPDGSTSGSDVAPNQSPIEVLGLSLTEGNVLTFSASGLVANSPLQPLVGPDGNIAGISPHIPGADNGIADIVAPKNSLIGVFLDSNQPSDTPAPSNLDFTSLESRNDLSLLPEIKQVFFIGDGATDSGSNQQIIVPEGATRLFLGTKDGGEWNNNIGFFDVEIREGSLATVNVNIEGVNDAPIGITLSNNSIAENEPANSVIGNLSTIDPDAGETYSYSLVPGAGSDDNSQFTISGNQILVNNSLDFEDQSSYSIRVQTDDGNGGTYEQVFTINVTDVLESSISGYAWDDNNASGHRDNDTIGGASPDVLFVVDVSGSTGSDFLGSVSIGDVNSDGDSDTILDAQLAGFIALNQELININLGNTAKVGIITFSSGATIAPETVSGLEPNTDADSNGILDIAEILSSITAGGATNFEAALQLAETTFNNWGTPEGEGNVIFLSDGFPTSGESFEDEVSRLEAKNFNLSAFGAGAGSSLTELQKIDANAQIFNTPDELLAVFSGLSGTNGGNNTTTTYLEDGLAGVQIYLDLNNNGILDNEEPVTITSDDDPNTPDIDETGNYQFDNLNADTYIVREVIPVGYDQATPQQGYHSVVINDETPITGINFGNVVTQSQPNLFVGTADDDNLIGTDHNDTIQGGDGNDTLIGGSGADRLLGQNDNDTLQGGYGNDILIGGSGADRLLGQNDNDTLQGGDGNDTLIGGSGADRLLGQNNNDNLQGGYGNDTLIGGLGLDSLQGDAGSDRFQLVSGVTADRDMILDYEDGIDILDLTGSLIFGSLTITQNGADTDIIESATNETLATLVGINATDLDSSDFV